MILSNEYVGTFVMKKTRTQVLSIRRYAIGCILVNSIVCTPALAQECVPPSPELIQEKGLLAGERFGYSVSASATKLVIGAPDFDGVGSAYLIDNLAQGQSIQLLPDDGDRLLYGRSVAVSESVVAVGSPADYVNGTFPGSVYLFNSSTGDQQFKIVPADAVTNGEFGSSVAIEGDQVVVGASNDFDMNGIQSGSAYLFDTITGDQLVKLLPVDGENNGQFGFSVAMSGTTIIVGAPGKEGNQVVTGSAYLFDSITGNQIARLEPSDGAVGDQFGRAVAIQGDLVVVGAPRSGWPLSGSGSAYVFNIHTGEQLYKLYQSSIERDNFGHSVSIHEQTILVGAPGANNWIGTVYGFNTRTGDLVAEFINPDKQRWNIGFGLEVAISGNQAIVGTRGTRQSAYIYDMRFLQCKADLNRDCSLDAFDASAFLSAFASNDQAADFNGDGVYNFFDISAFLIEFAAGCP